MQHQVRRQFSWPNLRGVNDKLLPSSSFQMHQEGARHFDTRSRS